MTPKVSPNELSNFHGLPPCVTISIISHGQMALVLPLLQDLENKCQGTSMEVILTLNIPEILPCDPTDFSFPLHILQNSKPLGFGANHNQALTRARSPVFAILNPDIRINQNPFPALLALLQDPAIGLVAPAVRNLRGTMENSARRFPTPWRILMRVLTQQHPRDYKIESRILYSDWVGGMCMLLPAALYRRLGGFDTKFFLYYEDVDLCARIRLHGLKVALQPLAEVTHNAQHTSHRKLAYMRWHLASMLRFFFSPVFLRIQWQRLRVRRPEPPRPPPRSEP